MNIKWNIFRLGSIYKKLSRPINAVNHLPPTICKMGLVCRECRKVAQHCYNESTTVTNHLQNHTSGLSALHSRVVTLRQTKPHR
jgi:hypothetical protein